MFCYIIGNVFYKYFYEYCSDALCHICLNSCLNVVKFSLFQHQFLSSIVRRARNYKKLMRQLSNYDRSMVVESQGCCILSKTNVVQNEDRIRAHCYDAEFTSQVSISLASCIPSNVSQLRSLALQYNIPACPLGTYS